MEVRGLCLACARGVHHLGKIFYTSRLDAKLREVTLPKYYTRGKSTAIVGNKLDGILPKVKKIIRIEAKPRVHK